MARIAFLGTPWLAVRPLLGLLDAGHDIVIVISRPDAKRGRGAALSPSPVKQAALEHGLRVSDEVSALDDVDVDLAVVVAYGALLPGSLVDSMVMLNLHFSDLPRWRGAAPVERAVLAGDEEVSVCVMRIVEELDAGPVYCRASIAVGDASVEALWDQLSELGTSLLREILARGVESLPVAREQEGDATYAKKLTTRDVMLDFDARASDLLRRVRVGRAWTMLGGERFVILRAEFGDRNDLAPGEIDGAHVGTSEGSLLLLEVKPAGRRAMSAEDWKRGSGAAVRAFDRPTPDGS